MPRTVVWFQTHPPGTAPDEAAYKVVPLDLRDAYKARTAPLAGTRVNYDLPGTRSLFTSTARKAKDFQPPYKDALIAADPQWGDPMLWATMRRVSSGLFETISTSPRSTAPAT